MLVKAIFDNEAECAEELSFKKGDILFLVEEDYQGMIGWSLCSFQGARGIAPGNRLKMYHEPGVVPNKPTLELKPVAGFAGNLVKSTQSPHSDDYAHPQSHGTSVPNTKDDYDDPRTAGYFLAKESIKEGDYSIPRSSEIDQAAMHSADYDIISSSDKSASSSSKPITADTLKVRPGERPKLAIAAKPNKASPVKQNLSADRNGQESLRSASTDAVNLSIATEGLNISDSKATGHTGGVLISSIPARKTKYEQGKSDYDLIKPAPAEQEPDTTLYVSKLDSIYNEVMDCVQAVSSLTEGLWRSRINLDQSLSYIKDTCIAASNSLHDFCYVVETGQHYHSNSAATKSHLSSLTNAYDLITKSLSNLHQMNMWKAELLSVPMGQIYPMDDLGRTVALIKALSTTLTDAWRLSTPTPPSTETTSIALESETDNTLTSTIATSSRVHSLSTVVSSAISGTIDRSQDVNQNVLERPSSHNPTSDLQSICTGDMLYLTKTESKIVRFYASDLCNLRKNLDKAVLQLIHQLENHMSTGATMPVDIINCNRIISVTGHRLVYVLDALQRQISTPKTHQKIQDMTALLSRNLKQIASGSKNAALHNLDRSSVSHLISQCRALIESSFDREMASFATQD